MPSEILLKQLHEHFKTPIITRQDFRDFLGISVSTDRRMLVDGKYPELVFLQGGTQNARMTLESLATWLENGGCRKKTEPTKRGRPVGSRNKPKKEMPQTCAREETQSDTSEGCEQEESTFGPAM